MRRPSQCPELTLGCQAGLMLCARLVMDNRQFGRGQSGAWGSPEGSPIYGTRLGRSGCEPEACRARSMTGGAGGGSSVPAPASTASPPPGCCESLCWR